MKSYPFTVNFVCLSETYAFCQKLRIIIDMEGWYVESYVNTILKYCI